MKEYVFKNDRLLMIYASILSFLSGYLVYWNKIVENVTYFVIILTLLGIMAIIALLIFTRVTYRVSENGIAKRTQKKLYSWSSFKEVIIGGWFIILKSEYGDSIQVINPTDGDDVFEQLKDEVMQYCDSKIVHFANNENHINLGLKGSIVAFYVHIIWAFVASLFSDLVYAMLVGAILNNLWLGLILYISKTILGIILIVFIPLKKRVSILLSKYFLAINFFFFLITLVLVLVNGYEFSIILHTIISLVSGIANILVYFRYLRVSKRVKNYFVK